MNNKPAKVNNVLLLDRIGIIISEARRRTLQTVNTILVKTYWEIGREIVEHELGGKLRADYGTAFLKNLAKELTNRYGKGFTHSNLRRMRQFYSNFEICATVSHKSESNEIISTPSRKLNDTKVPTLSAKSVLSEKMLTRLSWSHICLLLAVSDKDARSFYEIEIVQNGWSVRETKRQIESMLFERLALSRDKKSLMKLAQNCRTLIQNFSILPLPLNCRFRIIVVNIRIVHRKDFPIHKFITMLIVYKTLNPL